MTAPEVVRVHYNGYRYIVTGTHHGWSQLSSNHPNPVVQTNLVWYIVPSSVWFSSVRPHAIFQAWFSLEDKHNQNVLRMSITLGRLIVGKAYPGRLFAMDGGRNEVSIAIPKLRTPQVVWSNSFFAKVRVSEKNQRAAKACHWTPKIAVHEWVKKSEKDPCR